MRTDERLLQETGEDRTRAGRSPAQGSTIRERLRRGQHGPAAAVLLIVAFALARRGVEPVHGYFYAFAWYPALLVLDALAARRGAGSLVADRPLALAALAAWSIPFWLLFEVLNLRLENWYYVDTPADPLFARAFLGLAFATVLPGIVLAERALAAHGACESLRTRRFRVTPRLRAVLAGAGILFLALPLAAPRFCYPLVWGFPVLLLAPLGRRPGTGGLLRDLARGRPASTLRFVAAGLACGLFWEVMNVSAGARWIYTVPFFDAALGVEMPPLGFVGFAPFALSAAAFVRALETAGLQPPLEPTARIRVAPLPTWLRALAVPSCIALASLAAIRGMEERTVDSTVPEVQELSLATRREAAVLRLNGVKRVADLVAEGDRPGGPERLAELLLVPKTQLAELLDEARLARLAGIGAANAALLLAAGVPSVAALAGEDPAALYRRLLALGSPAAHVRPQRVRVWVRAAGDRG